MKTFPKKYTPIELRNRSNQYREKNNKISGNITFTPNIFPNTKKLSYYDFFFIYLNDFFNYKLSENNTPQKYEQLFMTHGDQIQNIASCYKFFSKRNQSLLQVGKDKIERHIISSNKKYTNTNLKILDSYTSSNHKIYIPDSDLYIYILEQIRSLQKNGKITNESRIGYRSFNLQTSIPFDRILRKEEKIPYYILKYFIGTKGEALYVYVEGDIDICCGDVALLVHPKDKRYNRYIGKNAIIPLCNRLIPIIGDETVNFGKNDGIKRVCPWVEEESIVLAQKHGLPTDIYAFDKQGLYTEYIHEKAFIGKERSKYYNNILEFIGDIGNMAESGEKICKVPYLPETNERLVPYKIDQLILDLRNEKQEIINDFFENNINYPPLNTKISKIISEYDLSKEDTHQQNNDAKEDFSTESIEDSNLETKDRQIKEQIDNELNLPSYMICNSQSLFGWKIPFLKDKDGKLTFFDIERDCLSRKEEPIQKCFNFVFLSLFRAGIIQTKEYYKGNCKICEYDKFYIKFLENEKKIEYFVQYFSKITGENPEYDKFLKIVENLSDGSNSTLKEFSNLVKNSKYIYIEGNRLFTNIQGIINDVIDSDFIKLCIPCYLENKGIHINPQIIFNENEEKNILKGLEIQKLLLGKCITNSLMKYRYNKANEYLGDNNVSKAQSEQNQWEIFSIYGENPIRLNLLVNHTFDQKEILLNSFFLKQIWNSIRLCIQKDFLPKDIKDCLKQSPQDFEDFDICVLQKLCILFDERTKIKTHEEYVAFFKTFKESVQNIFFSRYLEIIKVHPTKNVQFVCSYFFNFLLTILYPAIPEFVDAIQYIAERDFLFDITPIQIDQDSDYNTNVLYYAFIKIKQAKIQCNIKQHESCNIFIKSTPTIGNIIAQNDQLLKNYFHISEISYIRSHEQIPLGYEVFSDIYNDSVIIGIQSQKTKTSKGVDTLESIEKNLKDLEDKLNILRQRIQILPEGEQRKNTEKEYAKTKQEMENLTIKYSILISK